MNPETISTFLPDWLASGVAALIFSAIGMLMAKWIWGKYANRLALAVEENMNLIGQWKALGGAQHELFKKLRTRWQQDRESWEKSALAWKEKLEEKDDSIKKLMEEVKRLREAKPEPVPVMVSEIEQEELAQLREKGEDLRKSLDVLKDENRDLIDELADVRSGYNTQVERLSELEAQPEETIVVQEADNYREENGQLKVLLAQRSSELSKYREEIQALANGQSLAEEKDAEIDSLRAEINELNRQQEEAITSKQAEIDGLEAQVNELMSIRAEDSVGMEGEIVNLRNQLQDAVDEMADVRRGYNDKKYEIDLLEKYVAELDAKEPEAKEETLSTEQIAELQTALTDRDQEVLLLQEQVKMWEEQSEQATHLVDSAEEEYRSKIGLRDEEIVLLKDQVENLESIVADRNNEVEDANNELRDHLQTLTQYRDRIGELELAINTQENTSRPLRKELEEKSEQVDYLISRIDEVETALSERYAEINTVRAQWSRSDGRAQVYEDRTEELLAMLGDQDKETQKLRTSLERKEQALEPLEIRLDEVEDELAETRQQRDDLENELRETTIALSDAEVEAGSLRDILAERSESLEFANSELTGLRAELETRYKADEAHTLEMHRIEQQIDEYGESLEDRNSRITELESAVNRIENEANSLNVLLEEGKRNTDDLQNKLADLEDEVSLRDGEIGVFTREIQMLVETLETPEREGESGPLLQKLLGEDGSLVVAEGLGKSHTEALSKTIQDLRVRLAKAEETSTTCEREKLIMREQIETVREKYEVELQSRDKQIGILNGEVSEQQDKLHQLRNDLMAKEDALHQLQSVEVEEEVRTVNRQLESESEQFEEIEPEEVVAAAAPSQPRQEPAMPIRRASSPAESSLSVFFETGQATIKVAEQAKLDDAVRAIRSRDTDYQVLVDGFSDNEGSEDYNEALSAKRAEAVRETLIENGLLQSQIRVRGHGEDHQFSAGEGDGWKARRVEIVFVPEAIAEAVN